MRCFLKLLEIKLSRRRLDSQPPALVRIHEHIVNYWLAHRERIVGANLVAKQSELTIERLESRRYEERELLELIGGQRCNHRLIGTVLDVVVVAFEVGMRGLFAPACSFAFRSTHHVDLFERRHWSTVRRHDLFVEIILRSTLKSKIINIINWSKF